MDKYTNLKDYYYDYTKIYTLKYGYVQFKQEGKQITINLGNKRGLEIFNQNLKDYKFLKEINDRNRKKIEKIINNVETIL